MCDFRANFPFKSVLSWLYFLLRTDPLILASLKWNLRRLYLHLAKKQVNRGHYATRSRKSKHTPWFSSVFSATYLSVHLTFIFYVFNILLNCSRTAPTGACHKTTSTAANLDPVGLIHHWVSWGRPTVTANCRVLKRDNQARQAKADLALNGYDRLLFTLSNSGTSILDLGFR